MQQFGTVIATASRSSRDGENQVVDPGPIGLSLASIKAMSKVFFVGLIAYAIGYFGFSPSWLILGSIAYAVRRHMYQQSKAKASLRRLVLDKKNISTLLEDLPSWVSGLVHISTE
ncbi:extended synaptotagmin-1-like [Tropilaelaps mercedesae]|uniref:Extended synaptotagmin-1-like n=1 Tax=Tropilaelaps mercedesae TaxID=418985 RepID=A0A1V9XQG8_9ACAR|nr:extended synaptotagmin-1-like [Tropilaelaps mercedesae]